MIHSIIEQLANTSGTNDSIALLAKHKDNEVLKQIMFFAHDPNTTFGMKKVPADIVYEGTEAKLTIAEAFPYLQQLADRVITGNNARDIIARMLGRMTLEDADVITRVLKQDLKIAMGAKNINKAYGYELIQETPYMRCDLTTKKTLERFQWVMPDGSPGVYSEVKMDGQYLNHKVLNFVYSAESRNGKAYDFLNVMDEDFAALAKILEEDEGIKDPVFNGEAVVSDGEGGVLPRTTGNGIIQKFGKDSGSIIDAEAVLAVLWDVIPMEAYKKGEWNVPRKQRREIMVRSLAKLNSQRVRMVEFKPVRSFAEAFAYNTEVMERGDEGTIIKDERGPWKAHTSPYQLKMKLKFEVDLRVVAFNPGSPGSKFESSLGSVTVESDCGLLRCNMGSGFKELFCPKKDKGTKKEYSDDMVRQYIWDNQDKFMNKIICGEANDIVQDRNSDIVKLFLPIFKEWRHDKDTCDDLQRIRDMKEAAIIAACGV